MKPPGPAGRGCTERSRSSGPAAQQQGGRGRSERQALGMSAGSPARGRGSQACLVGCSVALALIPHGVLSLSIGVQPPPHICSATHSQRGASASVCRADEHAAAGVSARSLPSLTQRHAPGYAAIMLCSTASSSWLYTRSKSKQGCTSRRSAAMLKSPTIITCENWDAHY